MGPVCRSVTKVSTLQLIHVSKNSQGDAVRDEVTKLPDSPDPQGLFVIGKNV